MIRMIATAVVALMVTFLSAQNVVHDYLTVNYSNNSGLKIRQLTVISNAMKTEIINLKKTDSKDFSTDIQVFLQKVQDLEVAGWELYDTSIYTYPHQFPTTEYVWVMRRAKN